MIAGQQVIRVVDVSWAVGDSLGKILGPESSVGVLSVMHGEVWWPDAVMDLSLSEVPLLEEVALVFLMSRMNLAKEDHLVHQLSLLETLIHEQIVLLMDSSVASLAGPDEYLESSSQRGRVVGAEGFFTGPVEVTVVASNCVDLLFVSLDSVGRSDVVSVEPRLVLRAESAAEDTRPDGHE